MEFELESKVKKIDILQKKLEDEIKETNEKEAEFLSKSTRIDQKEIDLKDKEQKLSKGERYFQLVFVKTEKPEGIVFTDKLSETDRGSGGFGSTGK